MNVVLRWVVGAVGLFLTVKIGEALHLGLYLANNEHGIASAFAVIAILALVNAVLRPIVMFLFSGLNCLTLGLFSFVVNALMFLVVSMIADELHLGFHVKNFVSALFGSVTLSVITGILGMLIPDSDKGGKSKRRGERR